MLLDTPDHVNVGDQLIAQGEIDFLATLGIEPDHTCSVHTFDWRDLSPDTLILLHGGGNFGDVWPVHQRFRRKVIERYPNNQALVFPQSVQYSSHENLIADARAYSAHPNLTICVRDHFSHALLTEHFVNEILLLPDMAFASTYQPALKCQRRKKKLLLKRNDREILEDIDYSNFQSGFEFSDWPTFNMTGGALINRVSNRANRLASRYVYQVAKLGTKADNTFGLGFCKGRKSLINTGVDFLSDFDLIVTTRLHGHILSLLLGLPSILIDNNYGKNSRFHDTWLTGIEGSTLVKTEEELADAIKTAVALPC